MQFNLCLFFKKHLNEKPLRALKNQPFSQTVQFQCFAAAAFLVPSHMQENFVFKKRCSALFSVYLSAFSCIHLHPLLLSKAHKECRSDLLCMYYTVTYLYTRLIRQTFIDLLEHNKQSSAACQQTLSSAQKVAVPLIKTQWKRHQSCQINMK